MRQYQPNGPGRPMVDTLYPETLPNQIGHIVTVAPYMGECSAELALLAEGILLESFKIVESDRSYTDPAAYLYASYLAEVWARDEGFINLEHDIVPWPGALKQLWDCPEPFCRFQYPVFPPPRMSDGIGCMKFSREVVQSVSCGDWYDLAWWDLDGQVISAVKGEGFQIHTHYPHVAHVRRTNAVSRGNSGGKNSGHRS